MNFYCFFFTFFSLICYSQRYTSQWYGMDEGLPQNSIKDIIKDKDGFIWLSTDGGILRYDGANFLLYNDFKINNFSFKDFLEYGKEGIVCFNNYEEDCTLISHRTVKVMPRGQIPKTYLSINNKQYKRFYKNSFINELYPDIDCYYINTTSETYFFCQHTVEYQKGKGRKKRIIKNFRTEYLRNTFEQEDVVYIQDSQNRRTITLKNGIVSYDNQPSLYNDPKSKIYWHQGTHQVFVINNGDIYISNVVNGKPTLQLLMHYKNIENEFLYCMFYDKEYNKIYFGNVAKGLNIINLSKFYVPQKNIPFSGEVTYEALPFTKNSIITKQGIEFYKDRTNKIYSYDLKYDKRYLLYDNNYNLLYLEFSKIYRRYRSSRYQKSHFISFPERNIQGIYKADNYYVVSTSNPEFNKFYLDIYYDDQFDKVKASFKFRDNINFVEKYTHDLLYVGTSNGIYLISLSKNKIVKYLAKDLPIKEIQRTKEGNYWFTTYNKGFYLIKNNTIIKMPNDKDGYISNAHHILEDKNDIFWISSNNGLFKVSKKALLDYSEDNTKSVYYYRYTKENGLINNEFNGSSNPGGNILQNGEFVFPSMQGFVFFKPEEIKTYYPKNNHLYIERARIGKEIIYFKDTLRLKSDYKNVDIFLDLPYYYNIDNIYLDAKLEKREKGKWEEIKNKKYTLNNIDPGNYSLIVRYLIAENGRFTYKRIYLEIKPLFYQTLIFKILVALLCITVIIVIIQMRTNFLRIINQNLKSNLDIKYRELEQTNKTLEITKNKLKNESEYQQKIVETISHDITTPIRFLVSISQRLNQTEDIKIQKEYFDGIYKTTEQLYKFTVGLKEYTQLFKEDNIFEEHEYFLYPLIEDKKLLFEQIASDNSTGIINLCNRSITSKINKNILSTILHNLIDNAVKNTSNGEIYIQADYKNDEIEIGIFDTGKGMTESQITYYSHIFESIGTEDFVFKNYGLGLHMVIQLVKKLDAKIHFLQNTPKGTVVKIYLKTH